MLFTSFRGAAGRVADPVPEAEGWAGKGISFGVRQTYIQILSLLQPALASWQVSLPISEKDVNKTHLTGFLGGLSVAMHQYAWFPVFTKWQVLQELSES